MSILISNNKLVEPDRSFPGHLIPAVVVEDAQTVMDVITCYNRRLFHFSYTDPNIQIGYFDEKGTEYDKDLKLPSLTKIG